MASKSRAGNLSGHQPVAGKTDFFARDASPRPKAAREPVATAVFDKKVQASDRDPAGSSPQHAGAAVSSTLADCGLTEANESGVRAPRHPVQFLQLADILFALAERERMYVTSLDLRPVTDTEHRTDPTAVCDCRFCLTQPMVKI